VRLSEKEIAQLAAFKGMPEPEFIGTFTRLRQDRQGLALKENSDHSCIFLAGKDCAVQAVKPVQCREFPNRWMNSLWGRVPLQTIERDYPMLLNCAAVKTFIKQESS
jgi:Fe-S-cluster containining protein